MIVATYRLQLTEEQGFEHAAKMIDHIADLGVSHLYLSPILQAVPGSTHGYDATDVRKIDAARGGRDGFEALARAAQARGLRLVLDIVPNHMSAHPTNAAWWDVLRHGRASLFARWFDIHWEHGNDVVPDRLLLPVLGDDLETALASGALSVDHDVLRLGDMMLPLAPGTLLPSSDDEPTIDELRDLLNHQHYRLAHWRSANRQLDRRRFFDVTDLVGVRQDDPDVRDATHALILELCRDHDVDGLRVDHPDGLADPTAYVQWLRSKIPGKVLVVEKILAADEVLPADWPVDGTTGYECSAVIDRLSVAADSREALDDVVAEFTGETPRFDELVLESKRLVLHRLFGAELDRVVGLAMAALTPSTTRDTDPVDQDALTDAIVGLVISLPVYRTYIRHGLAASDTDRALLRDASSAVAERSPDFAACSSALVDVMCDAGRSDDAEQLVERFQQLTAAVTAKGVEDTAFYRFPRLLSLDEVGGDPRLVGIDVDLFHDHQVTALPRGLLALSTHDSKRSGDARHRLAALSEIPVLWRECVRGLRSRLDQVVRRESRDPLVELAVFQMLIALHPVSSDRLFPAALKAARESKRATSWLDPDPEFEDGLERVVRALCDDEACGAALDPVLDVVVPVGRLNSVCSTLLQMTVPGIPDIYQGSELWQLALADPDNRSAIDLDALARGVSTTATWSTKGVMEDSVGATKALVIRQALALRARHPATFEDNSYSPVTVEGPSAHHAVVFTRGAEVVTATTRLHHTLWTTGGWRDTMVSLTEGRWDDVLTPGRTVISNGRIPAAELFDGAPCVLLEAERR